MYVRLYLTNSVCRSQPQDLNPSAWRGGKIMEGQHEMLIKLLSQVKYNYGFLRGFPKTFPSSWYSGSSYSVIYANLNLCRCELKSAPFIFKIMTDI